MTTKCQMDFAEFPFDTQSCSLFMGPGRLSQSEQALTFKMLPPSNAPNFDSLSWKRGKPILTTSLEVRWMPGTVGTDGLQTGENVEMAGANFTLPLRREAQFYLSNCIYPVFMVTGVAYMNFFLPSGVIERMCFGAAGLLTIVAIMFVIADKLPQGHSETSIERFFNISLAFNIFACIESSIVISMATNSQFRYIKQQIKAVPCGLGFLLLPKSLDRISRYLFVIVYVIACSEMIEKIVVSLASQVADAV